MKLPVHRIIPFSNVEGIGNRTSIFVQGCNSNCLYCHNSETIPMKSKDASLYTVDELVNVIKGNMPFIRGITVSGGEATLHHKLLTKLFKEVHKLGITCYVDSNGFFFADQIRELIEVTDKFLFDIKGIGSSLEKLCFSDFLHKGAALVENHGQRFAIDDEHLENLKGLLIKDKVEEVRLVYIKGYYNEFEVVDRIAETLKKYPHVLFKLIRVHSRGLPKERREKLDGAIPSEADLDKLEEYAYNQGLTKIVKIY